jgi:hypothetical protein
VVSLIGTAISALTKLPHDIGDDASPCISNAVPNHEIGMMLSFRTAAAVEAGNDMSRRKDI